MFQHAQRLGEIHKRYVNKNPELKRKLDQQYKRFTKSVKLNSRGNTPAAMLVQKFQYPSEFIDKKTGKPYYLYQFCPIAVYWSVDVTGGFSYLFSRSRVIEDPKTGQLLNIWYWVPKFNYKVWIETDWATAQRVGQTLDFSETTYVDKEGNEKIYKRPPSLDDRYLTYNLKSYQNTGQNMKVKRQALKDVHKAYTEWFFKNESKLTGNNPELTLTKNDTIKPKYSKLKIGNKESNVMDPVWNLGITVRALYALQQLASASFKSPDGGTTLNVSQITSNKFYKAYINQINENLPPDAQKIDFKFSTKVIKTADQYIRENVDYLKFRANRFDGIFRPNLVSLKTILQNEGSTVVPIPNDLRKKGSRRTMTLNNWVQKAKKDDLPYYIRYIVSGSSSGNGIQIKPMLLGKEEVFEEEYPETSYPSIARELGTQNSPLIQNIEFFIFPDGTTYYPMSTSDLEYVDDNIEKIFDTMKRVYQNVNRQVS